MFQIFPSTQTEKPGALHFCLGHKFGRKLFKADACELKLQYLHAAEDFFAKYGPAMLVLERFVPIVRTYVPVAAGTAQIPYRHFIGWNVTGAALWVLFMTLVGVFLGNIPGIADSIGKIMLLIFSSRSHRSSSRRCTSAQVEETRHPHGGNCRRTQRQCCALSISSCPQPDAAVVSGCVRFHALSPKNEHDVREEVALIGVPM